MNHIFSSINYKKSNNNKELTKRFINNTPISEKIIIVAFWFTKAAHSRIDTLVNIVHGHAQNVKISAYEYKKEFNNEINCIINKPSMW